MLKLENQRFGRILVIDKAETPEGKKGTYWNCQCDCGNQKIIKGTYLTQGNTTSCGCLRREICSEKGKRNKPIKDLTNQFFGELRVIEIDPERASNGHVKWKCKCTCGKVVSIRSGDLCSGNTRSCGHVKSHQELKIRRLLNEQGIIFEEQYTFPDLKDKGSLRFDFAIFEEDGNLSHLIEFQGKQHYDKNNRLYSEEGIKRDLLKKQYCQDNNIPLVEILWKQEYTLEDLLFY